MQFTLSYLVFIALGLVGTVFGSTLPFLIEKFALTLTRAGTLFLVSSIGHIIGASSCAFFMRQFEEKAVMFVGALIMGVSMVIIPWMPTWGLVLTSVILLGFGWGLIETGFNSFVAVWGGDKSGAALNRLHFFFALGAWFGPSLIGLMLSRSIPWDIIYYIISGFYAVFLVGWSTVKIELSLGQDGDANTAEHRESPTFLRLLKSPGLLLMALIMFLYVGVEVSVTGWISTFLLRRFSTTEAFAAGAVSFFWAGLTAGRWLCSLLSDQLDYRVFILILCAGIGLSVGFAAILPWPLISVAAFTLAGAFCSGVFPMVMALGTSQYPEWVSEVTGFLAAIAGVGAMFMPWLLGAVGESLGLTTGMITLSGLMLIAVGLCVVLIRQTAARRQHIG